jgi:hypothetical protein
MMAAQMAAQHQQQVAQPTAAAPMQPAPGAAHATETLTPAPPALAAVDPLQLSLERMRASLHATPTQPSFAPAAPVIADAPPFVPEAGDGSYDALGEIVESAEAAKMRGRPVSILVLSAKDSAFAAGVVHSLSRRLAARGSLQQAKLDGPGRSAQGIADLVRHLSGQCDHLVIDGGHAGPGSSALADAAVLTVLVAPDDILDASNDLASRNLLGCSYFIVGPMARSGVPA